MPPPVASSLLIFTEIVGLVGYKATPEAGRERWVQSKLKHLKVALMTRIQAFFFFKAPQIVASL